MTVNARVEELHNSWRTELNAPEILPYKEDLVEFMHNLLTRQEELVSGRIENETGMESFTNSIYQADLERLRYSLKRYLRTRILKIEGAAEFITSNLTVLDRLSFNERAFLMKFNALNEELFTGEFYNKLHKSLRAQVSSSSDRVAHAQPLMEEYVFCKVIDGSVSVMVDDQPVEMDEGAISILKYLYVQTLVREDRIILL